MNLLKLEQLNTLLQNNNADYAIIDDDLSLKTASAGAEHYGISLQETMISYQVELTLSNVRVVDENIVYDSLKPFDIFIKAGDRQLWRSFVNAFRNCELIFGFGLERVQFAFSTFGIAQIQC